MIKVKYKGFTFDVNVKDFNISMKRDVATRSTIDSPVVLNNITVKPTPTVLSGKGYFVGDNALDEAYKLMKIYNEKGSDYVFSPYSVVLKAFFTKFAMSYSAEKRRVEYEFEFTEDLTGKESTYQFPYTFVREDENIFDLSDRVGIPVETIIERNNLFDLYNLRKDSRIWLM